MDCPACGAATRVLETRDADDGAALRRRRRCPDCDRRFTTFERREPDPLEVLKRDGRRQRFDRTKLRAGLIRAAHKRPVSAADVEAIVDRIEREGTEAGGEIGSLRIGELCLSQLYELDPHGAYLQYAGTLSDEDALTRALDRLAPEGSANRGESGISSGSFHPIGVGPSLVPPTDRSRGDD